MFDVPANLSVPPYHTEIAAYLQQEQAELWRWFSSNRFLEDQTDAVRLELLKSAYRADEQSAPRLYGLAHEAAKLLGLDVPITLYHSQRGGEGLNAHLVYLPDQVHIVLHGPLTDVLDDSELRALLGHELAHYLLWSGWDSRFFIVDQILAALADDDAADTPQMESLRLFRLYAEVFCDRGAWLACGELLPAIAVLVKTETGVRDVNAESYLRQAEEIASSDATKTAGWTHPECHIRTRALKLWDEQAAAAEEAIRGMIEGKVALGELDLLAQQRIGVLTRRLVDAFLADEWLLTDGVLGHARLFFDNYEPPSKSHTDERLASDLQTSDPQLLDYYCYVILDFVTIDRELEEALLAAATLLTDRLKIAGRFHEIVRKELGVGKRQLEKLHRNAGRIVTQAAREIEAK